MADPIEETNHFFDHNVDKVDAIAASLIGEGKSPADFVVLVIDASKGKGKTLVETMARQNGTTYEEQFRDLPPNEDPTLVTSMERTSAAKMIATWNSKVGAIVAEPPAPGGYWVVIIAAGVTRAFDRETPKHVGQA